MDFLEPALPLKADCLLNWNSLTLVIKLATSEKKKVTLVILKFSKRTKLFNGNV